MDTLNRDGFVNTSYKLRPAHIWNAMMNDEKENPICLAFSEAVGEERFFSCHDEMLIIAQSEKEYNDGHFVEIKLSFKMCEILRNFNENKKVNPMIMCVSEIPGKDTLLLHIFEENWKRVYQSN